MDNESITKCFYCKKEYKPKKLRRVNVPVGNQNYAIKLCGDCFALKRLEAINTAQFEAGINQDVF